MSQLSDMWTNEAYVSSNLVEEVLRQIVPKTGNEWIPQYSINPRNKVDFYIKDKSRRIEFFVEVKAAKSSTKSNLDSNARQQLATYFHHSPHVKYGFLIDPFRIECYQLIDNYPQLKKKFDIEDPTQLAPITKFLTKYIDDLTDMRTIVIHTSKGGVGKTTLSVNIAFELARRGNRVLVVDLDDQANTSLSLGVNNAEKIDHVKTIEEFEDILQSFEDRKEVMDFILDTQKLRTRMKPKDYIYESNWNQFLDPVTIGEETRQGCIDVLPGSYKTDPYKILNLPNGDKLLDKGLQKLKGEYDYVVIDTAPATTAITYSGLNGAQYLLIPSQMEYLSVYGIRPSVINATSINEDREGKRSNILGIVPMMTDNTLRSKTIRALIEKHFSHLRLLPEVSRQTAVGQALLERVPLFIYAERHKSRSRTAKQVADLTHEIITKIDQLQAA
ncbi:ParA family protein [Candidatus Albibeggiatoa sp. nov. NOAA]|uniref:ParA family protein n=1 Tax=Candidatus Albibeggiatoa sp. nov. NOAA TaxID=3162724 RepID=UPI0033043E0E|nr:ParA family protein [Thiotrichaceae bacterium]